MKTLLWLVLIALPYVGQAVSCDARPVELLAIGDSQTGASWGRSYYGNFLQKCLATKNLPFVIYGRGATQPLHWLSSSGLDHIDTIQRDQDNNHLNLGHGEAVPSCKRRVPEMLAAHAPKKVIAFFGDNLVDLPSAEITRQFTRLVKVLKDYGLKNENCFIMTPTFEMSVATRRNVPLKTLATAKKVTEAARLAVKDQCQFLSGLELMQDSPLLAGELLARKPVAGSGDCLGAAANDNIHVCGEAAREMAEKVCQQLVK